MAQKLIQDTSQQQVQTQRHTDIDIYWSPRLTEPFALAPKGVELTQEQYDEHNKAWGRAICKIMKSERIVGSVCIPGFGLGRESGWILKHIKLHQDLKVQILDASKTACSNAIAWLKKLNLQRKIPVVQAELLEAWEGGIVDDTVTTYFVSQFIEHQGEETATFLRKFGTLLKVTGNVLYLILPLLEDNDPALVSWDHAKPLSFTELQHELLIGLEGDLLDLTMLGKIPYCNRTYTCYKFTKR